MKNFVNRTLTDQINLKHNLDQRKFNNERENDIINLEKAQNMFVAEERAI